MRKKNRAWFIKEDGRVPLYFYIMFDYNAGPKLSQTDLMQGKKFNLDNFISLFFNVYNTKYATVNYIKTWDFLPNSTGLPLANEKALQVLEESCAEEFQALPTEIHMPNGIVLTNYKFINALNVINSVDFGKSKLKPNAEKYQYDWEKYDYYVHKLDCLGDLNIGISNKLVLLGSTKLKNKIKEAKLTGLTFKKRYGSDRFEDDC